MKAEKALKLLATLYLLHAVITTIKRKPPVNYPKGGYIPERGEEPVHGGREFIVKSNKTLKNRLLRNVSPN